ncbi:chemotaxis protein CheW [Natronobacterium gregoryi]|uniref:Chemotaxis protein CheW n=2 Tax=Natronobacterium gregoryi TaxID=44930 RepID=L0AH80_NATGS|nr:chemotaxis protein CheW [Natronobacterium gregoryi]AFZ73141.1 chemotaxis signal transduction protein [Natronobacterium gregoryi SP2]ELY70764.1 chemotaxis protein CheW [Natronobacterium gregoryi SP2]PLK21552.1 chemotaxis protein CheW [Natronobacterium gregoryi SP2]SFI60350.1 purine-binding chemotaxis protein CheW [Natronobacterium gregoryi]
MTDDRARRIREMRNRANPARSASNDTEDTDDGSPDQSTDESEDVTNEKRSVDGSTGTDETTANSKAANEDDSKAEPAATDGTSDESPATNEAASTDCDEADTDSTDETAPESSIDDTDASASPADDTDASATEDADTDSATGDVSESETDSGAVDTELEQNIDPALRGAIAGTGGVDSATGDEATVDATVVGAASESYDDAAIGRGKEVFERGDSLIASAHDDENTIQMLEFYLEESRHAIEIDLVSAIVEMKDITRFPRGPDAIDGVTDLRGEITGVLDPTVLLDVERNELSDDHYIVVIERDDEQKVGIRVSDVSQAVTYRESQIDETADAMEEDAAAQHKFVEGIIKKTEEDETTLVTWLDIDSIIEKVATQRTVAGTEA